ncbi:hypothetical protein ACROYT_G022082 [Oculina patagonica]
MPSRVTPNEASALGEPEMPSSTSVQPTSNDVPIIDDSTSDHGNVYEQLHKTIDEIYSPVLKLMKMFGIYFGDTSLKSLTYASGRSKKPVYLQRIYCGLVVCGFCFNFVMSFVSVFFGQNPFLLLLFGSWCLLIVLKGTISLYVLCVPIADTTKSRLENFLCNLLAVGGNVNLEKVKRKSRKGVIIFCFFFVCGAIGIITTYLVLNISIAAFKPWDRWFGFRIISLIFLMYGEGAWLLPVLFFYITCLVLEELFDDLHKRMSSLHPVSVDIETFKMEHHKLCEVVELADKMLSPLLFAMVSVYIPLICFNFYNTVNLPEEGKLMFLISNIFWFLMSASIVAIIMLYGSKVCDKIHGLQKILQTFHVSKEDEEKLFDAIQLVTFMMDLQGDPKGLSIGGLVVITKSMSLTIVGVIVSYFAVMLSLPK